MAEDDVSSKLRSWVAEAIGQVPVHFTAPTSEPVQPGIVFYLLGLQPNLTLRNDPSRRIEIFRRYLVCDFDAAGHGVEDLLFHAMETGVWQIEPEAPTPEVWLSLGLAMRPAFVLRVPVVRERPRQLAPPAKSVELKTFPAATLMGIVRSTGGRGLAGCIVELKELGISVVTGYDGAFAFPALVPAIGYRLRLSWKGREQLVDLAVGAGFGEPVIITVES